MGGYKAPYLPEELDLLGRQMKEEERDFPVNAYVTGQRLLRDRLLWKQFHMKNDLMVVQNRILSLEVYHTGNIRMDVYDRQVDLVVDQMAQDLSLTQEKLCSQIMGLT